MTRTTHPMPLNELPLSIGVQLLAITPKTGHMANMLGGAASPLVIVSLDERGAVGWAAAESSGLVSVFVVPKHRRKGVGSGLVRALIPAARELWPEVEWRCQVEPGSAGERFFAEVRRRVAISDTVQRMRSRHGA